MLDNAASPADAVRQIYGSGTSIESRRSVSGGDINQAALLTLSGGTKVFLKENRPALAPMFAAEAAGLDALAEVGSRSGAPPVPRPLAWGSGEQSSFLMMEAVEASRPTDGAAFGRALAELHREGRSGKCGFDSDNWIGSTPQRNTPTPSWYDFFAEHRLLFQWELARSGGYGSGAADRQMQSLCSRLPELIPDVDGGNPSLLHGDLWGGNWMAGADGRAWLIDPAVYYGHREADLAMTRLFGGFPTGFHRGYQESWPLDTGFDDRVDIYNLYHLLNHLNLFGSSYWGGAARILGKYS